MQADEPIKEWKGHDTKEHEQFQQYTEVMIVGFIF
jgi:hypothetical protein